MNTTSAAGSKSLSKAQKLAEIDYMLAEMKAAEVRIAAHQAETDVLRQETWDILNALAEKRNDAK